MHIELLIEYRNGRAQKEPVHAEQIGEGKYRILHSPGFVQGIAAGDTVRLNSEDGSFEVIERAGNIAVQLFSETPFDDRKKDITQKVEGIGGFLDGAIDRGMVFTIPLSAGFAEIERILGQILEEYPGTEWYYGNVYDPTDGITPLNWWEDFG